MRPVTRRVLIVEDEHEVAELYRGYLDDYDVAVANTGAEALELVGEQLADDG